MRAHTARHFEGRRGIFFVLKFALIVFSLVLISFILSDEERDISEAFIAGPIMGIAVGIAVLVFCRFVLPQLCSGTVRKAFRDLKLAGRACTYILDEAGVTVEDSIWGGRFAWDDLIDWYENRRFLMIYRSDHFFYYFSKAQIAEDDIAFARGQVKRAFASRA